MNSDAKSADCSFCFAVMGMRRTKGLRCQEEMCSNTTRKCGKKVSKPERARREFLFSVRIPQVLPRPGHGIAAISKVMLSARATTTAAVHFPKNRHQAVP